MNPIFKAKGINLQTSPRNTPDGSCQILHNVKIMPDHLELVASHEQHITRQPTQDATQPITKSFFIEQYKAYIHQAEEYIQAIYNGQSYFLPFSYAEPIIDTQIIGDILVIQTSKQLHYAKFTVKNNAFQFTRLDSILPQISETYGEPIVNTSESIVPIIDTQNKAGNFFGAFFLQIFVRAVDGKFTNCSDALFCACGLLIGDDKKPPNWTLTTTPLSLRIKFSDAQYQALRILYNEKLTKDIVIGMTRIVLPVKTDIGIKKKTDQELQADLLSFNTFKIIKIVDINSLRYYASEDAYLFNTPIIPPANFESLDDISIDYPLNEIQNSKHLEVINNRLYALQFGSHPTINFQPQQKEDLIPRQVFEKIKDLQARQKTTNPDWHREYLQWIFNNKYYFIDPDKNTISFYIRTQAITPDASAEDPSTPSTSLSASARGLYDFSPDCSLLALAQASPANSSVKLLARIEMADGSLFEKIITLPSYTGITQTNTDGIQRVYNQLTITIHCDRTLESNEESYLLLEFEYPVTSLLTVNVTANKGLKHYFLTGIFAEGTKSKRYGIHELSGSQGSPADSYSDLSITPSTDTQFEYTGAMAIPPPLASQRNLTSFLPGNHTIPILPADIPHLPNNYSTFEKYATQLLDKAIQYMDVSGAFLEDFAINYEYIALKDISTIITSDKVLRISLYRADLKPIFIWDKAHILSGCVNAVSNLKISGYNFSQNCQLIPYRFLLDTLFDPKTPFPELQNTQKNAIETNRLQVSEFGNPFVFPFDKSYRFGDKTNHLLAIAPMTGLIPDNKFGEFPFYLFAQDGIWITSKSTPGVLIDDYFRFSDLLLNNRLSICNTDLGITFSTADGIHLLNNQQIQELTIPLKNNLLENIQPTIHYPKPEPDSYMATLNLPPPLEIQNIDIEDFLQNPFCAYFDNMHHEIIFIAFKKNNFSIFSMSLVFNTQERIWTTRDYGQAFSSACKIFGTDKVCTSHYTPDGNEEHIIIIHNIKRKSSSQKPILAKIRSNPIFSQNLTRLERMVVAMHANVQPDSEQKAMVWVFGSIDGINYELLNGFPFRDTHEQILRRSSFSCLYYIVEIQGLFQNLIFDNITFELQQRYASKIR